MLSRKIDWTVKAIWTVQGEVRSWTQAIWLSSPTLKCALLIILLYRSLWPMDKSLKPRIMMLLSFPPSASLVFWHLVGLQTTWFHRWQNQEEHRFWRGHPELMKWGYGEGKSHCCYLAVSSSVPIQYSMRLCCFQNNVVSCCIWNIYVSLKKQF